MSTVGQPITEKERRERNIKKLIHYGLKMTVRRDIGGSTSIEKQHEEIEKTLRGMTAAEASRYVSDELRKQNEGVKKRQSRSIAELERRLSVVEESYVTATVLASEGKFEESYKLLAGSVAVLIGGEKDDGTSDDVSEHILV